MITHFGPSLRHYAYKIMLNDESSDYFLRNALIVPSVGLFNRVLQTCPNAGSTCRPLCSRYRRPPTLHTGRAIQETGKCYAWDPCPVSFQYEHHIANTAHITRTDFN